MAETALEEVRQAEKEASKLIEDAASRKEAIVSEAKAKAARFLNDRKEELAKDKAESVQDLKEKLLATRSKMLSEGAAGIKALRKYGEKKTGEAAELVLEALENEISKF